MIRSMLVYGFGSRNKSLAIRNLLELNETTLRLHGFLDPWREQKNLENEAAIPLLQERLKEIDAFETCSERWTELVRGVLAGKYFGSVDINLFTSSCFSNDKSN